MNKMSLITSVAKKTGLTKNEASASVNAMVDLISGALGRNEKVTITGFGSFDIGVRQARRGVNPFSKERIEIPALRLPRFRAGKALRSLVK